MQDFPWKSKESLLEYIRQFDAKKYARSRNFLDGNVSRLSPYITHGVITTQECVRIIAGRYGIETAKKFLMELVWKEFFLQVQYAYGNSFLTQSVWENKTSLNRKEILPQSLIDGETKTDWVNHIAKKLSDTGWLHNRERMWLASWCCHRAALGWKQCADWTYYHFIDGELSANHLSWQWVMSTFANKPYIMNEDNLQKFQPGTSDPNLQGTYPEVSKRLFETDRVFRYHADTDAYATLQTPLDSLEPRNNKLLEGDTIRILTPWRCDEALFADTTPTIVLLDNTFTKHHPWSQKRLDFIMHYTKKYAVPFVYGSYEKAIQEALTAGSNIILDQRGDPVYRETQEKYRNNPAIEILPYPFIYRHQGPPLMKFFKYWKKAKKHIKQREPNHQQSLF